MCAFLSRNLLLSSHSNHDLRSPVMTDNDRLSVLKLVVEYVLSTPRQEKLPYIHYLHTYLPAILTYASGKL